MTTATQAASVSTNDDTVERVEVAMWQLSVPTTARQWRRRQQQNNNDNSQTYEPRNSNNS